jgi:ribosomal-protein-alanine N-acetyltransferase
LFSDKEVIRFTDNDLLQYPEEAGIWICNLENEFKSGYSIFWGLQLKNQSNLIGIIGLLHIDRKHFFASIKVILLKRHWNKGLMTEATHEVVRFGFDGLGLNRIEAQIFVEHKNSIRMFEKTGFIKEGILRQNFLIEGKYENSFIYSILKSDLFLIKI